MHSILTTGRTPLLAIIAIAFLGLFLGGCGQSRPELRFSYVKPDSSEHRMLEDKQDLLSTYGVTKALMKIDAKNAISLELYVQDGRDHEGRNKALELGYTEVRNY